MMGTGPANETTVSPASGPARLRRRAGRLTAAVLAIGLGVLGVVQLIQRSGSDDRAAETGAAPSGQAPEGDLVRFDGTTVTLADYRGRPLVVNFWASWCPPCVAEMPDFEAVHRSRGERVAFLGVNLSDTPRAARELAERTGVTYDLDRDPDGDLFAAFKALSMPTTFFVSPEGRIVDRHSGQLSRRQLEAKIDELEASSQ